MALVNDWLHEIQCKVVYFGAGSAGKTSNVTHIYAHAPEDARGEVVVVPVDADPACSLAFLPLDLGVVGGYQVRFHLFTVPGLPVGEQGRAAILKGADGVVFVADSARGRFHDNLLCQYEMLQILGRCRAGLDALPLVIQYNKRDLPDAVPVPILNARLNPTAAPSFEAVAVTGSGVFATLQAISQLVLDRL